jgi:hypothetical protein
VRMSFLESSGVQVAVIGEEHILHSSTDNKTFVFVVDTNAMGIGDTVELQIYTKVLAAGVSRVTCYKAFCGEQPQNDKIKYFASLVSDVFCAFALKQTSGVGRSFPWKILSI